MADSNDKALQKFEHAFEGHQVTTIRYRGRECWVARQIGEAMDYANPDNLADLVRREWSEEFVEGEDFELLTGTALSDFKAALDDPGRDPGSSSPINAKAARSLILYESGLNIAAMKTEKPAGRALRRWLATEVLPAIRRTGAYAATDAGAGAGAGRRALPSPAARTARAMRREAKRLEAQGMRAAAEHLRLSALEALVDRAMPEVRAVLAAELAADGDAGERTDEPPAPAPALPAPATASKGGPVVPGPSQPKPWGRGSKCIRKRYDVRVTVPTPGFVTHPEDRNEEISRDGFPSVVEWRAFLGAWWATLGNRVVGTHQLLAMCDKRAMLGHLIGTGSERSRRTKLGILVARRTDQVEEVFASPGGGEQSGFLVRIERSLDRRSKVSKFRLVRVVPE